MSWREDLRRVNVDGKQLVAASFRGKPFFVEESERGGGRRLVVHQFPLRDDPFVEDLGRDAATFKIDGYVVGDGYLAKKNSLLAALESEGPGELVHPYYGVMQANCGPVSVRETRANGGMATFSIAFTRSAASGALTPTTVVDSAGKVAASATATKVAVKAELAERFDPLNMPAFALASAEAAVTKAAAGLASALGPVATSTQELAALTGQVAILTASASSLVRAPDGIVDAFLAVVEGLVETAAASPGAVVAALCDAYGIDLGPPAPATTATRQREQANQLALTGALRRVMALEAAQLIAVAPYASIEDATAARDRVAAMLEEQADGAGDTAYPALVTLRSDVLRSVPSADLGARIITVTRRVPIPSLLLAYQLYGDVDREPDLVARNRIRHPGFVAGDLQALTDG